MPTFSTAFTMGSTTGVGAGAGVGVGINAGAGAVVEIGAVVGAAVGPFFTGMKFDAFKLNPVVEGRLETGMLGW